jgi:thymidylate synthase (FAD)
VSGAAAEKGINLLKVTLLNHTADAEKLIAQAAKLCYSPSTIEEIGGKITKESADSFLSMLSAIGHESPIEHAAFTFGIEMVSRTLLAQITRHRIASFSVQSQRYVREGNFAYVVPPEILKNDKALAIYEKYMESAQAAYDELAAILQNEHFDRLLHQGMNEKAAKVAAEKMAIEDARFVLPNACETKMVVTMNARSLNNFFTLRCCNRAQWEIRELATEMLFLVREVAPTLFANSGPACIRDNCPEGKMSCGRMAEMRKRFLAAAAQ